LGEDHLVMLQKNRSDVGWVEPAKPNKLFASVAAVG
jgi:hypothetical protein